MLATNDTIHTSFIGLNKVNAQEERVESNQRRHAKKLDFDRSGPIRPSISIRNYSDQDKCILQWLTISGVNVRR